jgi:hypothetical protein
VGLRPLESRWQIEVRLSWMLWVLRQTSLGRDDHSPRGVLPSVVCLSVIAEYQQRGGFRPLGLSSYKIIPK